MTNEAAKTVARATLIGRRNGCVATAGLSNRAAKLRLILRKSSRASSRRDSGLAIAALAAIAFLTVIHRAILAALLARRLISRKRSRTNHCRKNRKENFGVLFHTRFNLAPNPKLRERKIADVDGHRPPPQIFPGQTRLASLLACSQRQRQQLNPPRRPSASTILRLTRLALAQGEAAPRHYKYRASCIVSGLR